MDSPCSPEDRAEPLVTDREDEPLLRYIRPLFRRAEDITQFVQRILSARGR